MLAQWGPCGDPCCPADLDGDGTTGIVDFLALLGKWGPCGPSCTSPQSLEQEVAAAGLTPAEWDTLEDCVVNGTPADSANCACWMNHYLDCHRPPVCVPDTVLCAGSDPLGHH